MKRVILTVLLSLLFCTTVQAKEVNIVIPSEIESESQVYFTTARVNIRKDPDTDSESIGILEFGEQITGCDIDGWIYCEDLEGFISSDYCSTKLGGKKYELTSSGFKSFESHSALSSASKQGYIQSLASTDSRGFRRIYDRYCVAIGTRFNASVGQYIDLVLENGTRIKAVVGDIKADCDTTDRTYSRNGCVSEFIVDKTNLDSKVRTTGDVSNKNNSWNSPVVRIIVYNRYIN